MLAFFARIPAQNDFVGTEAFSEIPRLCIVQTGCRFIAQLFGIDSDIEGVKQFMRDFFKCIVGHIISNKSFCRDSKSAVVFLLN